MGRLFSRGELREFLDGTQREAVRHVDLLTSEYLLNTKTDDLCQYYHDKYYLTTPELNTDQIECEQREVDIDVSQDPMRGIFDRSKPFYVKGTAIKFVVPFEGDAVLFKYTPFISSSGPPYAEIEENELHIELQTTEQDGERVQANFEGTLREIQNTLRAIRENVNVYNETFMREVRQRIEHRREKLLKDQGMAASIKYPMRKREGVPATYAVPVVRKKLSIQMPQASTKPFKPEPELEMKDYELILSIISNMNMVLERSPGAFAGMKEEDLRTQFLVPLNGQLEIEGNATGETFNSEGKTDILVRINGRNIFIAECKFWTGPEGLTATIDQLLRYLSWRDTKAAIILFNRNKNLSAVLDKIPPVIESHPNFKGKLERLDETRFRFTLRQKDDPNREILVTLLVFDVPT